MRKPHGRSSGFPKEKSEFSEEVVQIDRVTRVVKGGRRMRFRATVVVGNKKGSVGIGIGKANEVISSIRKASSRAKKNMINVPIMKDTIPHEIRLKFKSARILLMPASPGTGIIAGGAIRKVVELAGIKNILSKAIGSSNKLNNAKATWLALQLLKPVPTKGKPETSKTKKAETKDSQNDILNKEKESSEKEKTPELTNITQNIPQSAL